MNDQTINITSNETLQIDVKQFAYVKRLICKKFSQQLIAMNSSMQNQKIMKPLEWSRFFEAMTEELIESTSFALNIAEEFVNKEVFLTEEDEKYFYSLPNNIESTLIDYLTTTQSCEEELLKCQQKKEEIIELDEELEISAEKQKNVPMRRTDEQIIDIVNEFKTLQEKTIEIKREISFE